MIPLELGYDIGREPQIMASTHDGLADRNEPEPRSFTDYTERQTMRAKKAAKRAAMIASMLLRATPSAWPGRGPDPTLAHS